MNKHREKACKDTGSWPFAIERRPQEEQKPLACDLGLLPQLRK